MNSPTHTYGSLLDNPEESIKKLNSKAVSSVDSKHAGELLEGKGIRHSLTQSISRRTGKEGYDCVLIVVVRI